MITNRDPRGRRCGECSLCCTVLRVDEIAKLAGTCCTHVRDGGGCAIHPTRPRICRAYECLWLRGKLDADDRPDKLGALLDFVSTGPGIRLSIREATRGAFDRSPRLQELAEQFRTTMPVRITNVDAVLDPDRAFRVLLPNGEEQRVEGDRVTVLRDGVEAETRRMGWPERSARRFALGWQALRLRWIGSR